MTDRDILKLFIHSTLIALGRIVEGDRVDWLERAILAPTVHVPHHCPAHPLEYRQYDRIVCDKLTITTLQFTTRIVCWVGRCEACRTALVFTPDPVDSLLATV